MDTAGKSEEFEKLWRESVDRAGRRPTWNTLSLNEKKGRSAEFRSEMDRYGREDLTVANRTGGGLYGSPTNSSSPGSTPG